MEFIRVGPHLGGCVSVTVAISRDLPLATHVMVANRLPPAPINYY